MANEAYLALLRRGVDVWNAWRRENPNVRPNLHGASLGSAKLSGADLSDADLGQADLDGAADLRGADLDGANLRSAKLGGADLTRASLSGTSLYRADLRNADLCGAYLMGTDFQRAYLDGTDLTGGLLSEAVLADVDLSNTRGLEACRHIGPSVIDHRTLQRSGPLPLDFLRGVGLPDNLIDYLPPLFNQAIQFYSCFISYSSKNGAFAHRLHADLQANGVRCWFAPKDLKTGAKTWDDIDRAIRLHDKVLLVLSKASVASEWVEDEVNKGYAEERSRKQTVLFPVRIDNAVIRTNEPWATKLRDTRNIGDFTRWKDHDAYRKGFERLLRDLKPELERRPGQGA